MRAFCKELLILWDQSAQVARLRRRTIVTCSRKLGQDPDLAIARMLEFMDTVERDLQRVRRIHAAPNCVLGSARGTTRT